MTYGLEIRVLTKLALQEDALGIIHKRTCRRVYSQQRMTVVNATKLWGLLSMWKSFEV